MPEASAAVAAAQLLAFCKDPVRHRPRLTHGREIPPVGLHAFRFAQGKFPHGLLRELPAQERERLRKAARLFIRQICFWDGATHYQVLCVPPDARRETIKEHYHGLIALIHPDRQDADSEHWPAEAAHRVNLAYAVLSDAARRADYDVRLQKARADRARGEAEQPVPDAVPVRVPVRVPARGRFAAARVKFRKPVLFVTAAVASVFFLHAWIAADIPGEYATLESATPFDLTLRAMRNVFSPSDRPRYLVESGGVVTAQAGARGPATRDDNEPFLAPLFRLFSGGQPDSVPKWVPPATKAASTPSVSAAVTTDAAIGGQGDPGLQGRVATAALPPAQPARAGREPATAAQASLKPSPADRAVGSIDMEALVASMVAYYEAGDLDRLLGLMDAGSLGVWQALRLRTDFRDFFEATRRRHLHFQSVSWETAGEVRRAKGQAMLVVDYRDETPRLERAIRMEMDVRVRDGQPRIARLSLYPHE